MSADYPSLLRQAGEAVKAGRFQEAISLGGQARSLRPDDPMADLALATIEARAGDIGGAIARFQNVAGRIPEGFDAHFWLAVLLRERGDLGQSLKHARKAVELRPKESHVYSNLGLTQMAQQEFAGAMASFEHAIRLSPQVGRNYEMLGKTLWLQGKEGLAFEAYRGAERLGPVSADGTLVMAQIAAAQNRTDDAIELARRVPESSVARVVLAGGLIDSGDAAGAKDEIDKVLRCDPTNSTAFALAGMHMEALGKMEEAKDAYRRSIELQPEQGLSYCCLARSARVKEADRPLVERMKNLAEGDKVNSRGKSFLHFGLGKALDDLGEYERAIRHFDIANDIAHGLKFGDEKFDRDRLASYVDSVIDMFGDFSMDISGEACPIFIVGMMRSGTTLAEQILSSHPKVDGAGERSFWLRRSHEAVVDGMLDAATLKRLAARYLEELRRLYPSTPRITDKMPGNYRVLGTIASAFPNAKIVHSKRNPIDTCLSIYFTPNRVANDFANNRENIVFAYREYERLMKHWEAVLGPDRMMTVEYEALVTNPEPTVRKLLSFCGLEWDDRCLRPHENERSVITPSVWQVRQPVYTSSVERWRKYEPWLGAFADLRPPL